MMSINVKLALVLVLGVVQLAAAECESRDDNEDNPCRYSRCTYGCVVIDGEASCRQKPCPSICPALYKPVCGSDGKTYSNECQLNVAACQNPGLKLTKVSDGECRKTKQDPCAVVRCANGPCKVVNGKAVCQQKPACQEACYLIYQPICGSDGKTYGNQCELEREACQTQNKDLVKVSDGECS